MKKSFMLFAASMALLLTACSSNAGSGPLARLADCYAQIADNNTESNEAFRAVYEADGSEQQALQQKAVAIADRITKENAELADKAKEYAAGLQGTTIPCSATDASGITVENATFETVSAGDKLANIVIRVPYSGVFAGKPWFALVADDGRKVYSSTPSVTADYIACNFRITTNKGSALPREFALATGLLIGTETDGSYSGTTDAQEPEPAMTDEPGDGESSATDGDVTVTQGANLVETLKAAPTVTYEYNADSGIWATIGNICILISEEDLSPEGEKIINALTADIEPDVALTPGCFKSKATIRHIEK